MTDVIDMEQRRAELEESRLAGLPLDQLQATLNQQRFLSDKKIDAEWKKKHRPIRRPRRFRGRAKE
jgi:hypothetical protein